ncbi:hypothetical protein ACFQ8W_00200 [Streptomyces sp. NPDC056508]|uniref:hypothetical protein n=1 Tax=Streptomyces sp. NPDC056508 TaxID=3345845 RepID=UPI00369FC480
MSYNAGNKVRIATDGQAATVPAVITGRKFGVGRTPDTLYYRDNCPQCSASTLHRHAVGAGGTYIAN